MMRRVPTESKRCAEPTCPYPVMQASEGEWVHYYTNGEEIKDHYPAPRPVTCAVCATHNASTTYHFLIVCACCADLKQRESYARQNNVPIPGPNEIWEIEGGCMITVMEKIA